MPARIGAPREHVVKRRRCVLVNAVEPLEALGRHRAVGEHERVVLAVQPPEESEPDARVPLAEVNNVRLAAEDRGLKAERECELFHVQPVAARDPAECSCDVSVPL